MQPQNRNKRYKLYILGCLFLVLAISAILFAISDYKETNKKYHSPHELKEGQAAVKAYGFYYITDKRREMGSGSLSIWQGQDSSQIVSWELRLKDSKYGFIEQSAFVDRRSVVNKDCYQITVKISTFDSDEPCEPTALSFGGYPVVRRFPDSKYFLTNGTLSIEITASSDAEASLIVNALKPLPVELSEKALATTYIHLPLSKN